MFGRNYQNLVIPSVGRYAPESGKFPAEADRRANRVGGAVGPDLSHHRAYGSVHVGSIA